MSLIEIFKSNKARFILIFIFVTIGMAIDSGSQYLMTPAYNYLKKLNFPGFMFFLILSLLCDLVRLILITSSDYLYSQQIQDYLHQIRQKMSRYFFANKINQTAKVQNEMSANLDQLTQKYAQPLKDSYMYLLVVIFSIGFLFSFHWSLLLLTLIMTLVSLTLPKIFSKKMADATIKVTEKNEWLLDVIAKWDKGLEELRRYACFRIHHQAMAEADHRLQLAQVHQGATVAVANTVSSSINIVGQMALMLLCTYLYLSGQIVFGAVITAIDFSDSVMNGITYFVARRNTIQSARKLNEETIKLEKPVTLATYHADDQKIASLATQNLSIHFPNGEQIAYPDLEIKQGEKVLLTGDSGTGKSTLFKLLLGQEKPTTGRVIFKDKNGQIFRPALDELGYLAQDGTLFPETIANNITMFDQDLENKVVPAAQRVALTKDLQKFKQGINTQIDLDDSNLSGGQKQKVVLARALVYERKWLFIDEGTSAIDTEGTKKILKNLLTSDQTVVMIAHNFSSEIVNLFDRQIILRKAGEGA